MTWFSWNGAAWVSVTKDPRTDSSLGQSPSGTFITNTTWVIVDAAGAVWTLVGTAGSYQINRNGVSVQSASNVLELLYYQSALYQATLTTIATVTPGGASITDIHGNVWKIDSSGNVLENNVAVPGGSGTGALTYIPQTDTIYAQDQGSGNWFFWNGTAWNGPVAAPVQTSGLSWSFWNNGVWTSVSGDPRIFGASNPNNPTFSDEFTSLNMYNIYAPAAGQTWQPAEDYAPLNAGAAGGQFWKLNPFNPATPINNIYTVSNGILNMRVDNTPSQYLSACGGCPYLQGQLQTALTFSQTYGYFEVRMAIQNLGGTGAGFILYSTQGSNQIDVIQIDSNNNANSFQAGNFALWDAPSSKVVASFATYNAVGVGAVDCSQFHQYGVLVTATTTSFYIDRVLQGSWPTPSGYNVPLYPLIYMGSADPSSFYGNITSPGSLPITGQFDYVKVWTAFPGTPPVSSVFDDEFSSGTWMSHQTWQSGDMWEFSIPQSPGGATTGASTWWVNPIATPSASSLYALASGTLRLGLMVNPGGLGITEHTLGTIINNFNTPGGCYRVFGYHEFSVAVPKVNGLMFGWDIENHFPGVQNNWSVELNIYLWTDTGGVSHVWFQMVDDGNQGSGAGFQTGGITLYSTTTLDISKSNTYGLDWQFDFIRCYINGVQVGTSQVTPGGDWKTQPMGTYVYTNGADYNAGDGTPSDASLPAFASFDYYKVYPTKP